MIKILGASVSPFVRKVHVFCREKGLPFDYVATSSRDPSEELLSVSPMRKIPALIEDNFGISDSSVICAYLEKKYPDPALYPSNPEDYARALWLEEYADTRLSEASGPIFFNTVIKPKLMGEPGDQDAIDTSINELLPDAVTYLESELGGNSFFIGNQISIADISIASILRQIYVAKAEAELDKYPKLKAWLDQIYARPSFQEVQALDDQVLAQLLG